MTRSQIIKIVTDIIAGKIVVPPSVINNNIIVQDGLTPQQQQQLQQVDILTSHASNTSNPHNTNKEQVGLKIQQGTENFVSEKTKNILFPTNYFSQAPKIDLTFGDNAQQPPYRVNVTPNGFTIKTVINYSGAIDWKAIQI